MTRRKSAPGSILILNTFLTKVYMKLISTDVFSQFLSDFEVRVTINVHSSNFKKYALLPPIVMVLISNIGVN